MCRGEGGDGQGRRAPAGLTHLASLLSRVDDVPCQGVLNATKAVATILSLARSMGCDARDRQPVVSIDHKARSAAGDLAVRVTTTEGACPIRVRECTFLVRRSL